MEFLQTLIVVKFKEYIPDVSLIFYFPGPLPISVTDSIVGNWKPLFQFKKSTNNKYS